MLALIHNEGNVGVTSKERHLCTLSDACVYYKISLRVIHTITRGQEWGG